jgi:hypothetical protein
MRLAAARQFMKRARTIFLSIAWFAMGLLFSWLVMGSSGPRLESWWAWGASHLPGLIQRWLQPGWMHLFLFAMILLPGGWLLKMAWPRLGRGMAWLLSALGYGLAYKAACFLPDISSYPFSLSWSEASRFYYASLYLSEKMYGLPSALSILHPSRYLLQAVPFLITDSPLWLHRAWQVLLWLVTSGLTGWLVARRAARSQHWVVRLALAIGAILFLFQGPVYYHLLVMVILVLWGFNQHHPWRTLVVVLLASLWAGISRVNWLPVPGMLAAAMYFLEVPYQRNDLRHLETNKRPKSLLQGFIHYLLPPAAWTILGSLAGWGSQQAYQVISGNPAAYFGSSFSSDLLWYRLLPNPTYPLGILPSALLVSLPVWGLMALRLIPSWRSVHPLRLLGLGTILGVLFAGGVVVSVKIGGGSNLHNLDAYLVLLLVVGSYGWFGAATEVESISQGIGDKGKGKRGPRLSPWLVGFAAMVPLIFALSAGGVWPQRDVQAAEADLATLRQAAQQAVMNGGRVLLINQRHLLTFGELPGVPLEADYELVFLMEMAMAGNPDYLDAFQADLQSHRFDLIIAEPLAVQYQGSARSFGEENDAWVSQVSAPVLCHYQPYAALQTAGVVLYVPTPDTCP